MFSQFGKLQNLLGKSFQNTPDNRKSMVSSKEQLTSSNLNLSGSMTGVSQINFSVKNHSSKYLSHIQ